MFEFLGKIPENITIAVSGHKNSMVVVDYLSRSDRNIKMLHVDFDDKQSKDRIAFLKSTAKHLKLDLEIIKGKKSTSESMRGKELYDIFTSRGPSYVLTAQCLDDVVVNYVYNSLRLNPKLMQYRSKNIIRPFINISQDDLNYWASNKKVAHIENESVDRSSNWLIRRHMLDNCYKVNPNLNEDILAEINREFGIFMNNRNNNGKR